ncbi:helicase-related protein [Pseudomonas aeruginosa]|uniref:helicase-related protein n=1 Tax=Pseudomonas aeruginosa TaxID=287 RepID=UPI00104C9E52|nr:helicase-related protein [Pseudomonas aeruginosa]
MTILEHDFLPGNLVRARGREWVVQSDSRRDWLRLRPLSGADDESIALIPELELHPVEPATFDWPDPARAGSHAAALLLRDALRLTLRAGAGPFRSFGNIAVEPRGYQLVPLLMALRLSTVRLLIADDVGIGKTIEAGLIARELMDRGEIARLAILCPPHLVEQWQSELEIRFNLQAVALTSASASRIERDLPHGVRLFDHHPVVVVSLDYIKSERHREQFLATAPECIIVDEAHTCASSGAGKQLRFELLQRLARDAQRHLILLTATPHSGDETAFYNRLEGTLPDDDLLSDERLHDGEADDLSGSDLEPPAQVQDAAPRLQALIADAQRLSGKAGDPKLAALIRHIGLLVKEGYHPVVFCRYIATAHYVAEHIKAAFPKATVDAVTGELTPEERRERVDDMEDTEQRILVATDCLSEGINLQHLFTAVVHYDLAWNPTRHEQREGRVDRFGQQADEVRCTMLYGQDNPVDGFVLNVIIKKGEAIQKELGVLVPMPEDTARINQALVKAALMKRSDSRTSSPQVAFDFGEPEQLLAPLQAQWRDALEKAKANRTVFAQRRIKPDEVLPEWHKQQQALGTQDDVQRFLQSACVRLGSPLEIGRKQTARFLPQHLPEALRQRLADEGIDKPQLIDFSELHRSHPLVGLLAQHLLEDALSGERPLAARCAATLTNDVEVVTTLYLLRLRHQLSYVRRREPFQMMAEETVALAVKGRNAPQWLADDGVSRLLECTPSGNLPPEAAQREIRTALDFLVAHPQQLQAVAQQRADALLADHQRVREATRDVGQYSVSPCLPVDVMGVYVLLPDSL